MDGPVPRMNNGSFNEIFQLAAGHRNISLRFQQPKPPLAGNRPPHATILYIEREKGSLASEDAGLLSTGRKTGDEWDPKEDGRGNKRGIGGGRLIKIPINESLEIYRFLSGG